MQIKNTIPKWQLSTFTDKKPHHFADSKFQFLMNIFVSGKRRKGLLVVVFFTFSKLIWKACLEVVCISQRETMFIQV